MKSCSTACSDSLGHVSDMVEAGGLGEAYVRLDGLEETLRRRSRGLCRHCLMEVVSDHLNPRVGVAYAKFPAYAAARTAGPMSAVRAPDDVARTSSHQCPSRSFPYPRIS